MNVLFLSTAFPQPGDPVRARYNQKLCEALSEEHHVTVISPVAWTRRRRTPAPPVAVPRVHYPRFVYPPGILRSTHAWWLWHSIRGTLQRVVDERPPCAVVSYWTWPDGAVAARLARLCGVPSVMIVGGSDVLILSRRAKHRQRVQRTLAQASVIVSVSEQLRGEVEALGVPPDRIALIRRGVDHGLFSPGSRTSARQRVGVSSAEDVILWVGRLSPVKGPDLLLDSLERLSAHALKPWRCVIIGEGPLRSALTRRAHRGPLHDRVTFINRLDQHDLAQWYRAADVLVVSSRSEGVPNVLYEAKACGTPVVATDVGDVAHFLEDGDGLVPPGDIDCLTAEIARVLLEAHRTRTAYPLPTWKDSAAAVTDVILRARASREVRAFGATVSRADGRDLLTIPE